MKILLSSYHNPAFTNTTIYRERAIEALGHTLVRFDDRQFLLPGRLRQAIPMLHNWDLQRLNHQLVKLARTEQPDLFLAVGGQRILPETIKSLKAAGIKTALWTTDVPIDFENILRSAPLYDDLFCAGTEAIDIFKHKGLTNAIWVPFGCDPEFHKPVLLSQQDRNVYERDVVFVGSYYPNRARLLEALAGFNMGIWGPHWDKLEAHSPLKTKTINSKVNFDQWVKIYNAAKIVIVVHYQNPDVPCHQASPKLFEAMACQAFVLCDNQKDVRAIFQDGQQLAFFENETDLCAKVSYYLDHVDERRRIQSTGYQEVLAHHTYQERIKKMLSIINKQASKGAI
ncbi:MAG: glycosyltransferase [Candidatus Omnitrophica bacterium]|nr:glycosyltransferase [Candidatus Omnitrophota bacterium]